jgi:hypothetical protein
MEYRCKAVRQNNSKRILAIAGFFVAALLAGGLWHWANRPATPLTSAGGLTNGTASSPLKASANPAGEEKLKAAAKQLAGAADAPARNQVLAALKAELAAGSTNEISAAIRRFLDSKTDAPTRQGFKIGKGGFLAEAPTLRTWLLDYLGRIDPAAAAAYARVILNTPDSPDEWALALRNLAAGDANPEARALLKEKFAEMLAYEPWRQSPSTGYLEAFDTAVYLGDAGLAEPLTGLVRAQDNQAVAHAAYLALDRMVISDPVAMLTALENDPSLMQGRENTRADYFARADVQDARQRQIVESYLLNPRISQAELGQFSGIFPNANFMISPNLLTSNPTPDHAALVARDQASLQIVGAWLADARFAKIQPQLQLMQQRLQQFVQQEKAAGQ